MHMQVVAVSRSLCSAPEWPRLEHRAGNAISISKTRDLTLRTLDLVFRVEDIGVEVRKTEPPPAPAHTLPPAKEPPIAAPPPIAVVCTSKPPTQYLSRYPCVANTRHTA